MRSLRFASSNELAVTTMHRRITTARMRSKMIARLPVGAGGPALRHPQAKRRSACRTKRRRRQRALSETGFFAVALAPQLLTLSRESGGGFQPPIGPDRVHNESDGQQNASGTSWNAGSHRRGICSRRPQKCRCAACQARHVEQRSRWTGETIVAILVVLGLRLAFSARGFAGRQA